jgi:hypothetical protein
MVTLVAGPCLDLACAWVIFWNSTRAGTARERAHSRRQLRWLPQFVLQVPLVPHLKVQPPPGQVNVQLAAPLQVISHPPPAQSLLQIEWSVQV